MSSDASQLSSETMSWRDMSFKRVVTMLCLGFAAGVPILLIFSTLSLWLGEAGVKKSAVTMFSWAALGYSFKFVWAPIVDKLPIPFLNSIGRRRSWLLLSQIAVIGAILWMASVDPSADGQLKMMALAAVMLGFSSATQDVCIDAFRIEFAPKNEQALLASCYVAGYRIGMIVASAGALFLADSLGTTKETYIYSAWQTTYWVMAAVMLLGGLTTLLIREPLQSEASYSYSASQYLRFFMLFLVSVVALILVFILYDGFSVSSDHPHKIVVNFLNGCVQLALALAAALLVGLMGVRIGVANKQMVLDSYVNPTADFFVRYGKLAVWILLLVGFYRVSDIILGVISSIFYQDLGYTKTEIGAITKGFGLIMTIVGSFLGGFLSIKIGVLRVLLIGAVLSALTNLLFVWLSNTEPTLSALTLVIAVDNLCAGLAVAAFVAWLSSLTSVSFTATQYAIFSSLMTLFPKLLGGYSGTFVESMGYASFFTMTAIMGIPVVLLILFLMKKQKI